VMQHDQVCERLPAPWMRAMAFANATSVPDRNSISFAIAVADSFCERGLDFLRVCLRCEPRGHIHRVPLMACFPVFALRRGLFGNGLWGMFYDTANSRNF
jgi:hypothetical protein